ncbi:flagellar protein FlaG [Nitratiruptor tergarcus]|uniref:Flagellar protein FlaG n=1 Tax=Nitratiruptor tergarcus DSM 16512 TaxID=1069081 RepID=A0A1W1WTC9_9BACT|nr:flagellar protein FlaG [Nitratiruptor tergarcus]SMC09310.1 flagellar protein FlaG [Nitratiruptor tergarcus DSM 16512]
MDVKAIQSTQAAIDMHTANLAQKNELSSSNEKKLNDEELFKKLDPLMQNDIIKKTVEQLNEKLQLFNSSLRVEIDKDTGIQVVKIVDSKTKEVIRQLPPESVLKIAKYIDEITGLLFEKKV